MSWNLAYRLSEPFFIKKHPKNSISGFNDEMVTNHKKLKFWNHVKSHQVIFLQFYFPAKSLKMSSAFVWYPFEVTFGHSKFWDFEIFWKKSRNFFLIFKNIYFGFSAKNKEE